MDFFTIFSHLDIYPFLVEFDTLYNYSKTANAVGQMLTEANYNQDFIVPCSTLTSLPPREFKTFLHSFTYHQHLRAMFVNHGALETLNLYHIYPVYNRTFPTEEVFSLYCTGGEIIKEVAICTHQNQSCLHTALTILHVPGDGVPNRLVFADIVPSHMAGTNLKAFIDNDFIAPSFQKAELCTVAGSHNW